MRPGSLGAVFAILIIPMAANAQVTINMDAITCAQYLSMTPSMSRDFSAWLSGWYSYQTRRTSVDLLTSQANIAKVKSWCRYSPQKSVMSVVNYMITPQ